MDGVTELVKKIWGAVGYNKDCDMVGIKDAEKLILDFIKDIEISKKSCVLCKSWNNEIGCETCKRQANDNFVSISDKKEF